MKKVLALVLAIAMMSTVAFAADYSVPGDPKLTDGGDFSIGASAVSAAKSLNTDNYSIKRISDWTGKAYVDSISLNSDEGDALKIVMTKDYNLDKIKEVKFTVELNGKSKVKNEKFTIDFKAGFTPASVEIGENGEIDTTASTFDIKTILKFKSKDDVGMPYGTLDLETSDGDTSLSVRMYDGDKVFLGHNYNADKKVLVANADSDAEISFLNFPAKPSFNSSATVYFYQVDEDGFIYELTSEGKIKKSNAKWSDDDGCWVLKTRTLGSYVFSDKALVSAAAADGDTTPDTDNPDTGANDVVGIAAALAVVSLVAAGAVSLKK